jgi:hypothetical protein
MDTTGLARFVAVAGPCKGREFTVGAAGARVGRASKNDVVLDDALLSRHHCRIFFKSDGSLWVTDLGSANRTCINGREVEESPFGADDTLEIGDTRLRLVAPATGGGAEGVGEAGPRAGRSASFPLWLWLAVAAAALVLAGLIVLKLPKPSGSGQASAGLEGGAPESNDLTVRFEKVEGSSSNIFRYALLLEAGRIAIEVDDLANGRQTRKDALVATNLLADLSRRIEDTQFFDLPRPEYRGGTPDVLEQWDLSITIGRRTRRVLVVNYVPPEPFRAAAQALETFGKNELGLWTIQYPAEELVGMAEESLALGRKLMDERDVRHGNLSAAVKKFKEAEWYLESVDPKPAFYPDLRRLAAECGQALEKRFEDQNFLAERAINVGVWQDAARELRVLCDLIPDRSDPRNQEARKKLLDVEARLAAEKR